MTQKFTKYFSFLIIPIFLLITSQFLFSSLKLLKTPAQDFEVFYLSGQAALNHQNPYLKLGQDIVRNPPPTLLLFSLFHLFPILTSQIIWFLLSFLIFILGSYFLFKSLTLLDKNSHIQANWKLWLSYLSLTLIFFPFRYNLGSGQINNLLFLLLTLSFYLSLHHKTKLSALSLALAITLKITPFFLLYTFLIEKKTKTIFWTIFFTILICLITGLILGFNVYQNYLAIPGSFFDFGISTYYNQSLAGFLARISSNYEFNKSLVLITLALALIFLFTLPQKLAKNNLLQKTIPWNLSLLFMLIFAPFTWQYHFVIIIFPLILTAFLGYKMKLPYKFFALFILSYLLVGWNIKNPEVYTNLAIGPIILSHVFLGSSLLLFLNFYLIKSKHKA